MKLLIIIVFLLLPKFSYSDNSEYFNFTIQSVYDDDVILNVIGNIFGDLDKVVKKEVQFQAIERSDLLIEALKNNESSLILWGYSKSLDIELQKRGYLPIVSAPFITYLYEYTKLNRDHHDPVKVGILHDSSALYSAKQYFKEKEKNVEYLKYDNYFDLIQACFRKEFDLLAATPTFLLPQPVYIQNRFKAISKLPPISSVTIWAKQPISEEQHQNYFEYFISKQVILGKYTGTGDFKKTNFSKISN